MRFVFALLAVIGLLASPVAAAVAPAGCHHPASASMPCAPMPGMNGAVVTASGGDHTAKHKGLTASGCAQACAAGCAVAVALAPPLKTAEFVSVQAEVPALRAAYSHPFEPQGLKRPPKSMG